MDEWYKKCVLNHVKHTTRMQMRSCLPDVSRFAIQRKHSSCLLSTVQPHNIDCLINCVESVFFRSLWKFLCVFSNEEWKFYRARFKKWLKISRDSVLLVSYPAIHLATNDSALCRLETLKTVKHGSEQWNADVSQTCFKVSPFKRG